MITLQVLGTGLLVASWVLTLAGEFVIRHVTSRSLGSLAPGFAASRRGYNWYAALVGDIGLLLLALSIASVWLVLATIALFVLGSVVVIVGEVVTYRNLKR